MKTLAAAFLALILTTSLRADDAPDEVLKNGDFSSAINHWSGDVRSIESSSFDEDQTPPTAGAIVKMRGSEWTRVIQDVNPKIGQYDVTITYAAPPDLKFSDRPEDYKNVPGHLGFGGLSAYNLPVGNWSLIINDSGAGHFWYWKLQPKLGAGPQTLHLSVQIESGTDTGKSFILVFPPGHGYINLLKLSMTPAATGGK